MFVENSIKSLEKFVEQKVLKEKKGRKKRKKKEKDHLDCCNENIIYQWKENRDTSNNKKTEKGML